MEITFGQDPVYMVCTSGVCWMFFDVQEHFLYFFTRLLEMFISTLQGIFCFYSHFLVLRFLNRFSLIHTSLNPSTKKQRKT